MYWLDMAILALLGFGAGLGFWSGLLWQVARLASLALALYATLLFNEPVARLLREHAFPDAEAPLLRAAAYVVVFLAVYVLLFGITRVVHETIRAAKLEFIDRTLGALLGAGKMAVIVAPVCAALAFVDLPVTRDWLSQSTLAPLLARGLEGAVALVPEDYRLQARDGLRHVRETVQRNAVEQALEAGRREDDN